MWSVAGGGDCEVQAGGLVLSQLLFPSSVITCPCLLPPSLQNYAAMKLVKPFS